MDLLNRIYEIVYAILLAIYCMLLPQSGETRERDEGFISLPGLKSKDLSLYPNKGEISARGGDDRYRMFEPYLRQTEISSREQRDNHEWPIGRTLVGSTEQTLSKAPVLPCSYPVPTLGGEALHDCNDAIRRNKLTHSRVDF